MNFETLDEMIPYVTGGKLKVLTMSPYSGIVLAMPGRHAKDTEIPGGDAVVMVSDELKDWTLHQFKHQDIFEDVEEKFISNPAAARNLMSMYEKVVIGESPATFDLSRDGLPGIHQQTFLYAAQALAVIEHRRYARFAPKGGGKWLPFRFSLGITEGLWTASEATAVQKMGRPGVEMLERKAGKKWTCPKI